MTPSLTWSGVKRGRKIWPDDPDYVGAFVEALKDGDRFTVEIKKEKRSRSRGKPDENGNQLGFFFGVVCEIVRKEILFGLSKEDAYELIMQEISYKLVPTKSGKPVKQLIHVNDDMTTQQMADVISNVQIWAATEHGVWIPDPDPAKSKRLRAQFLARGGRE